MVTVHDNVVIGRMHAKDGFVIERNPEAERSIRLGLAHGGDPFNAYTPVVWCEFTEAEFASFVAHVGIGSISVQIDGREVARTAVAALPQDNTVAAVHFDRLDQRRRWLTERIEAKKRIGWDFAYDVEERDALVWALAELSKPR